MLGTPGILFAVSGTPIRSLAELPEEVARGRKTAGQADRAEQIAELRAKIAALGGEVSRPAVEDAEVLAVSGPLSYVLPNGGLPRKAVTQCSETPALVVEIISQVAAAGGYAGVVGWPELSYAGVGRAGLERVIAVPDPGIEPVAVAGVLAEGLDLVVMRSRAPLVLTPVRARPLLARLRKGSAALVAVNTTVPSPALAVAGRVTGFHGIGEGQGRIAGIDIHVRAEQKGTRPASTTLTLGAVQSPDSTGPAPACSRRPTLRAVL